MSGVFIIMEMNIESILHMYMLHLEIGENFFVLLILPLQMVSAM